MEDRLADLMNIGFNLGDPFGAVPVPSLQEEEEQEHDSDLEIFFKICDKIRSDTEEMRTIVAKLNSDHTSQEVLILL